MFFIDSQIDLDQHDGTWLGPYIVVDIAGDDLVVRMDREGRDAAFSIGEQDVDWEYIYVPVDEARPHQA